MTKQEAIKILTNTDKSAQRAGGAALQQRLEAYDLLLGKVIKRVLELIEETDLVNKRKGKPTPDITSMSGIAALNDD